MIKFSKFQFFEVNRLKTFQLTGLVLLLTLVLVQDSKILSREIQRDSVRERIIAIDHLTDEQLENFLFYRESGS